jgi:hypothetical protein
VDRDLACGLLAVAFAVLLLTAVSMLLFYQQRRFRKTLLDIQKHLADRGWGQESSQE